MRKSLLLALSAGAVTFGLAPLAAANPATPEVRACSPENLPANDAGEGMIYQLASDDVTTDSCSFVSSGAAIEGAVASLNAWTLTATDAAGNVRTIASQGNVIDSQTPPSVQVADDPAAGETITLTVTPACDPSGAACGASVSAAIGADSARQ